MCRPPCVFVASKSHSSHSPTRGARTVGDVSSSGGSRALPARAAPAAVLGLSHVEGQVLLHDQQPPRREVDRHVDGGRDAARLAGRLAGGSSGRRRGSTRGRGAETAQGAGEGPREGGGKAAAWRWSGALLPHPPPRSPARAGAVGAGTDEAPSTLPVSGASESGSTCDCGGMLLGWPQSATTRTSLADWRASRRLCCSGSHRTCAAQAGEGRAVRRGGGGAAAAAEAGARRVAVRPNHNELVLELEHL